MLFIFELFVLPGNEHQNIKLFQNSYTDHDTNSSTIILLLTNN